MFVENAQCKKIGKNANFVATELRAYYKVNLVALKKVALKSSAFSS